MIIIFFLIIKRLKKGNNNTNSTSKIKKINATKKNRIEIGARLFSFEENPHSNGLCFWRSMRDFKENTYAKILIRHLSRRVTKIKFFNNKILSYTEKQKS